MKIFKSNSLKLVLALVLLMAFFGAGFSPAGRAAAACSPTASFDLYAKTGSATLFGSTSVTIWGYASGPSGATDPATLPGPVLTVSQGDCVQVTLHNQLSEASAINFQGQSLVPDTSGAAAGGTATYTFVASNPGTFLYEAGLIPGTQHQVAMGLFGALVVNSASAGTAYGSAATAFDQSNVLVLSEVDPALNGSATPATFDMRNYAPKYFLVNGKAYATGFTGDVAVTAGSKVLLRYVNAGLQSHAMSTLGVSQLVVAASGRAFANAHNMVAETIATGQTLDVLVAVPAATGVKYPVFDANLMLRNASASGLGGMLTFLSAGVPTPPASGPLSSGEALSPNPTNASVAVTVSATVSDVTTGGTGITGAEYFIDNIGANGAGTAMTGSFGSQTISVSGTISTATLASLASGSHTVYVHGQDNNGWGPVTSAALNLDKAGPATSSIVISPASSNGTVAVSLSASASDTASGNSNIAAGEYAIDGGAATAMAVNVAAPSASLSASIPAATINALTNGTHTVAVRSRDALGNWGAYALSTLRVDKTGPVSSSLLANPNPNNGSKTFNTSVPAVRVTAMFSDSANGGSTLAAAEGFIDTVAANGSGFAFIATDGTFNSVAESGYADVPIAVVGTLTAGNHTIYIHAKDAAGNWGATAALTLVIDKTAPTFTSVTLSKNAIIQGTASVTFTVNGAADAIGLANAGKYWIDANAATAFTGSAGVILATNTLAAGTHTLSVQIQDKAGNWSTTQTAALNVAPDAIFSDGFEAPTTLPGNWTSASTTTTTRLNNTATAALVGTRGLQAQGNNTNYLQYNFGSSANLAWATFDARFSFNPRNNASTGQVIFSTSTTTAYNASLFSVRYRRNGAQPQVQLQVGATANAAWVNINNNAANVIQVVYQSGGSLNLYVNGVLAQTLTGGSGSVTALRLGSVNSGGDATLMYFDQFAAKRTVSPLLP